MKSCSIIIPCYNEAENIAFCVKSIPNMGAFTEIIFVDDGSIDGTKAEIEKVMRTNTRIKLVTYSPNQGKAYAVRQGFAAAQGDILMILDADLAVPAEELPAFFTVLNQNKADFANGTRFVYPMESGAMPYPNQLGNQVFGLILSVMLRQKITDTLCGTKALFKRDYLKMQMKLCPWGDFDLLFGAAGLGLRIMEIPVHYKRRIAGVSKMKPFKTGWKFSRVCIGHLPTIRKRKRCR
jgi:glycosyltransferase involved in cell wall biosynthesis